MGLTTWASAGWPKNFRGIPGIRAREPAKTPGMTDRPDPAAVRARALGPLRAATWAYGGVLAALAVLAPGWTGGDLRAALLPGIPAVLCLALGALARTPARCRVCMALVTTIAGFLALTTAGSLGALGSMTEETRSAVLFQVGCLAASGALLAVSAPCWRRTNEEGGRADDLDRMYDEL